VKKEIKFKQLIEIGCGIDVHKEVIVATIRKSEEEYETRSFEAFTSSLTDLRAWYSTEKVTHIAMESTGIYWKPVYHIFRLEKLFA
jgi:transposase